MKVQAIIPAAGLGKRLKSRLPKALVLLHGKPIAVFALRAFQQNSLIDSVIVAVPKGHIEEFKIMIRREKLTKVKKIVEGGATRRESVSRALKALDRDTDIVLIHDAARPFVTKKNIADSLGAIKKEKAAVVAVPVKSTIKVADKKGRYVKATPRRDRLWEIQTPQVFQKGIILKAHKETKEKNPSDDALLVERLGVRVKIVPGDYKNIKVTTKDDLIQAESFLKARR